MIYWLNLLIIPIEAHILRRLHLSRDQQARFLIVLVFLQWCTIAAFRSSSVGWDTPTYEEYFYTLSNYDFIFNLSINRLEPFYILLNNIVSYFINEYRVLLGIIAIIIYGLILYRIPKYSVIPWLSCFLFVAFGFYNFSINILRQSIAIAIIVFSYQYILDRRLSRFLIVVTIASLFHYTAIIFIPTYFLYKLPVNYKTFILLILGCLVIANLLLPKIMTFIISSNQYYEHHLDGNSSKGYGMLAMLLATALFSLVMLPKKKIEKYNHLWMIMIFMASAVQIFSLKISILVRVVYYWQISMFFLFPSIVKNISNTRIRQVSMITIILVSILYYFLYAINQGDVNGTVPYKFSL